jgi:hypothetical protein
MSSSSNAKSFDDLQASRTRARGDTKFLLPSNFEVNIDGLPECPKPEASLSDYSAPRLQKSLIFVENVLAKQDITPRQEHFYQLFIKEESQRCCRMRSNV